jgi:hypothetical protein
VGQLPLPSAMTTWEVGVGMKQRLSLLGRLLLSALCFLRHLNPPFRPWCGWRASRSTTSALCRLARWPGCRRPRFVRADSRSRRPVRSGRHELRPRKRCRQIKKWGAPSSTPSSLAEELPLLRGLFLPALGSFLRHCFLLRICGSTSDGPRGRHNGWAEPSTLIPDVDYG